MIRAIQRLARDMSIKMLKQDVIANNLANAATAGFKAQNAFARVLGSELEAVGARGNEAKVYTSFEQGPIEHTDRPLDLAINGEGFFVIDTPSGERFTRSGSFTLTEAGLLATRTGDSVMGEGGSITIEAGSVEITPDGKVVVDGGEIGDVRIVRFAHPERLVREGNLYASSGEAPVAVDFAQTEVVQGALEGSNVNPIDEMVNMIGVHRGFESNQKSMTLLHESARQLMERVGDFRR